MKEPTLPMKNMYVIYHGRFPGEKAAAIFAAKEANSFIDSYQVTLLVPRRVLRENTNPHLYFGISNEVRIVYLPVLDPIKVPGLSRFAFSVSYTTFAFSSLIYLALHTHWVAGVITNEPLPALLATLASRKVVFEVHDFPEAHHGFYKMLFRRVYKILCTNLWKLKEIERRFQVPKRKLFLERNAVDTSEFGAVSKKEARESLGLPPEERLVVYTGHLYGHKGGVSLADAAALLPSIRFMFVGGTEYDQARFSKRAEKTKNVQIIGQRPHAEMPLWQAAADVLVIPNSAQEEISARYTSPMKLFEYMASERPIVASEVPSIAEVLPPDAGYLVSPDSPEALAEGIRAIFGDMQEARERAERARACVQEYTWSARASRIAAQL